MHHELVDISRTAAPGGPIVTLDEAKRHLRIEASDEDDARVTDLITAVDGYLDGYNGLLGRSILTQTWKLYLPGFWSWRHRGARRWHSGRTPIDLPAPPLQQVTSVAYVDTTGTPQTLTAGVDYTVLDGVRSQIVPTPGNSWPDVQDQNPRAVTIIFTSGLADDAPGLDKVAPGIRQGALLLIGHWYANREAVVGVENRDSSTEVPIGVAAVLAPWRLIPT